LVYEQKFPAGIAEELANPQHGRGYRLYAIRCSGERTAGDDSQMEKRLKNMEKIVFLREKLLVESHNGYNIFYYKNIKYIKSDHPYSNLIFNSGEKVLVLETITNIFKNLPAGFLQCGRSVIVNCAYVKKYFTRKRKLILIMEDSTEEFTVARDRQSFFIKTFNELLRMDEKCLNCRYSRGENELPADRFSISNGTVQKFEEG
jgi:DNA-binding LytR/AlgR family response regulator